MTVIQMHGRHLWTYKHGDEDRLFFESCAAAVLSLIVRGVPRSEIEMDYESETGRTMARKTAARFVEAYGKTGARFMVDGVPPEDDECPPLPGGTEWRAPRKVIINCPHCGKPIRQKY